MDLQIYDTLTKKIKKINIHNNKVFKFYCCGPTLYGVTHIGNFRTFIVQDILRRILIFNNINHLHVRNLTDIDDKIIKKAKEQKTTPKLLAKRFEKIYYEDMKALKNNAVTKYARATDFIPQIISQIKTLIKKGYAYKLKDGYYFNIKKCRECMLLVRMAY